MNMHGQTKQNRYVTDSSSPEKTKNTGNVYKNHTNN